MQESIDYRLNLLSLIAVTSSLGSLTWGYCISIINSVGSYLQTYALPSITPDQLASLSSALVLGASIGSYYSGKIVGNLGRRKSLILCDIAGLVGFALCAVKSLQAITLGRFISGLILGVNSTAIPLYNIEMAPLKLKGIMSSMSVVVVSLGVMLSLSVSNLVPNGEGAENSQVWRVLMGLPALFCAVRLLILMYVLKFETPLYLALQERTEETKAVLEKIYTHNIDQHMQKVIKDKEAMSSSAGSFTLADLLTPKYRRAFLMGFLIAGALQLSGFSPIFMFFNLFIAESANNDPDTLALFSTLLGLMSFLCTLITALVVEKFGRRPLMVYGTLFLFLSSALYLLMRAIGGPATGSLKYLLILWSMFYRLSAGTLGFVYISELLPTAGVAFAMFMNWLWSFAIVQTLLPLATWVGVQGLMLFYAVFSLFAWVVFQKYLIESKGRTKAELLELYSTGTNQAQANQNNDVEMQKIPFLQK